MNQWCFSRQALELHSPSRRYDLSEQRVTVVLTYCSYLRQLGSKLRLHHLTIVKATMFCHRFFARQSFAKNDWYTVATACIFLAGKVEDSQRRLKDVVNVAFGNEIQHHIVNQMYKPQYIAVGSVAVAASILKLKLPASDKWLEGLDVSPKELNDREVIQKIQSKLCRVKTKEVIGSVSSC